MTTQKINKKNKLKNTSKNKTRKNVIPKYQNDFYSYVNHSWLKNIVIKKNRTTANEFVLLQDKSNKHLHRVIHNLPKNDPINDVYLNFQKFNNSETEQMFHKMTNNLDDLRKDKNNLWELLSILDKNMIDQPFHINISYDDKCNSKFIVYIDSSGISLDTRKYYFNMGKYEKIRKRYLRFIQTIFHFIFGKYHNFNTDNVLKVEKLLASNMYHIEEYRNPDITYNKKTIEELESLGFNWKKYGNNMNYNNIKTVIVTNPKYIKNTCILLKNNWNSEEWKPYWIFKLILFYSNFHKEWNGEKFLFFSKYLMGQEKNTPLKQVALNYTEQIFNARINKMYVNSINLKNEINYIEELCKKLVNIFRKRLQNNCWLSFDTKQKAIHKLENITFVIGHKNKYMNDPTISFKNGHNIENYLKYCQWNLNEKQKLINTSVNKDVWDKYQDVNVFDVNAYYLPNTNEIVLPHAYIQSPFINLNKPIEYNVAWLGATIGHEMCHAFDDEGSKYDHNGNYKNWWSEKDVSEYKKKQKDIIILYEKYAKQIDNRKIDAELSLGENIADIGGLLVCEELLLDYYNEKNIKGEKRINKLKEFYTYFAESWRSKNSAKRDNLIMDQNEHLISKYRANCSLMKSDLFRSTYNIQKGDYMYLEKNEVIW